MGCVRDCHHPPYMASRPGDGVVVRYLLARRIASSLLLTMAVQAFSIPIFLLGIYFVLQVAGLTRLAVTVLGGTGLLGIVVGFAFRDIAENFLASMLLSIRNPFRTGELIEVDGNVGIVMNLNVRSTVLRTLDGSYVQIPNALVYKSTIKNYSSAENRRADFAVGIGYNSPTTKAQTLIANVLKQHPAVLETPEPLVLVEELGSATVNLRIYYWFASAVYSPEKINSALLRLSKDALLKGGIELPDPAREVVFPQGIPVFRAENIGRADAATRKPLKGRTRRKQACRPRLARGTCATKRAKPAFSRMVHHRKRKPICSRASGSRHKVFRLLERRGQAGG